jgi:soluble lytic murein transglycosylase-like protein
MHNHSKAGFATLTFGLSLACTLLSALPARADQIVAVIDAHGRKVYINTGEPDSPTGSFRPHHLSQVPPPAEIDRMVRQAAGRAQIDPKLVHAIIQVESEYNPNAVSDKGAMGLMQLVPATAQRFGVQNPFDPEQNIHGGVNYLKYLLGLFNGNLPLSLAAYNAGENSVLRSGGIPSFAETQDYIRKVTGLYTPGSAPNDGDRTSVQSPKPPIYRYVDAQGVVHFTNGTDF